MLSSHFQLLERLYVERSETVLGNACPLCCASLFFTDRVSQTSVPPPTRRSSFMEVVCGQKCCTSCFEPVLVDGTEHHKFVWWRLRRSLYISWRFDWLNRFENFCSLCCTCLFFADVSRGESHKHDFVPHPMSAQLTKKKSRPEADRCQQFVYLRLFQRCSDHRSVALPFHLRARVVLASLHRTARPNKTELGGLPSFRPMANWSRCCSSLVVQGYFLSRCLSCMIAARDGKCFFSAHLTCVRVVSPMDSMTNSLIFRSSFHLDVVYLETVSLFIKSCCLKCACLLLFQVKKNSFSCIGPCANTVARPCCLWLTFAEYRHDYGHQVFV